MAFGGHSEIDVTEPIATDSPMWAVNGIFVGPIAGTEGDEAPVQFALDSKVRRCFLKFSCWTRERNRSPGAP